MQKKINKFIQKAHLKPGALHKQLEIPTSEHIPKELLEAILGTKIGNRKKNPTNIGKREFVVTPLLWHRAHFAYILKGFHHKRK